MWLTLGLASLLADPDLIIRSWTECPSAAAVVREVASLLPAGTNVSAEDGGALAVKADGAAKPGDAVREVDHVEISAGAGKRWLRVRTGAGQVTQPRELPASLTCDEAARAAALLLAAWQFPGGAELSPLAPTGAASPRATPSAPPTRAPIVVASPPSRPSSPPVPPPPSEAPWRLAVGGGFSAGRSVNQYPMNAMLEIAYGRLEGIGLRAHGALSSRYSLALGPGRATWTRSSLGAGATFTGRRGPWGGQAHADVVGASLDISGEGFAVDENSRQYAVGGTLGGRVLRALGPAELWLDLSFTAWPGRNQVFLRDAAGSLDLSSFEVFLGVGTDFFVWQ